MSLKFLQGYDNLIPKRQMKLQLKWISDADLIFLLNDSCRKLKKCIIKEIVKRFKESTKNKHQYGHHLRV